MTLLFFCSGNNPQVDSIAQELKTYKQNRSLLDYLSSLYDLIDAQPAYYCAKTDSLLQTIWQQPASKDEQEQYLDVLLITGYHLLKEGQVSQSTRWYEAALTYEEANKIPDIEWEELIATPLGNNYTRMGDYEKALLLQQKALQSAEEKQAYTILPSLYGNYATTLLSLKNFTEAKQAINKGLRYVKEPSAITGMLCNLYTTIYQETEKPDSAAYWNKKALQFFTSYKGTDANASWYSKALVLSATLLMNKQEFLKAKILLRKAQYLLDRYFPTSQQREKAKLAIDVAANFYQTKNVDSALNWYRRSLQFFPANQQGLFPDYTFTDGLFGIALCFEQSAPDSALYYYGKAIGNDYYAQQLIGTAPDTRSLFYSNENLAGRGIVLAYHLYVATSQKRYAVIQMWLTELSKGRKLLYEQQRTRRWATDSAGIEQQTLIKNIQYYYLQLAETNDPVKKENILTQIIGQEYVLNLKEKNFSRLLQMPQSSSFEAWLSAISATASVVSYYEVADTVYATYISGQEAKSFNFRLQDSLAIIPIFIEKYFSNGIAAYNNNPSAYFNESNKIAVLILPVLKNTKSSIIISPDGVLHRLPFEALYNTAAKHFLGEEKTISYSFSLLQYLNEREKSPPLSVEIFGLEGMYKNFPALAYVKEEVGYIRNNFSHNYHVAEQTSEADFLVALQQKSILHIATHGVANNDAQQPYLVLKENLYLNQIQYSTVQCPLVVLTACETAAGKLENKEGNNSIGRAFLAKGVQGVIANRWQANDKAAATLITLFYEAIKKNPDPAMALQKARSQYLQQCTDETEKNPWLWAGFCYQGVNQEIYIVSDSFLAKYRCVIISGVVLLLIAFVFFRWFAAQTKGGFTQRRKAAKERRRKGNGNTKAS